MLIWVVKVLQLYASISVMWKAKCTAWKERKSLINVFLGLKMTWKMFGGKAKLMGVLGAISMELHFLMGQT